MEKPSMIFSDFQCKRTLKYKEAEMVPHAARMREINAYTSLAGKYLLERMTEG
jgi:hypothetical protein